METVDRSGLCFPEKVREHFSFLEELGFSETESLPTFVRYEKGEKGDVEVHVYHGRLSYEIAAEVFVAGTRYDLLELASFSDPETHEKSRHPMTYTRDGVARFVEELSILMKRFGGKALGGDAEFLAMLEERRNSEWEQSVLDELARWLRPKAREAFRQRDYAMAADLYSQMRESLTRAELKKLDYALRHSKAVQLLKKPSVARLRLHQLSSNLFNKLKRHI